MSMTIGILFALVTMITFGLSEIFAKLATDKIGGKKAMFFSQVFGLILIATYVFLFIEIPPITFDILAIALICSVLSGVGYITFFKAMEIGDVSIASPIAANWVMVTVIFSLIFLNESLTMLQSVSILLLITGVFLMSVVWKDFKKSIFKKVKGVKEAIITMLCWGTGFFLFKFIIDAWGSIFPQVIFKIITVAIGYYAVSKSKIKMKIGTKTAVLFLILAAFFDLIGIATYGFGVETEFVSVVSPIAAASPLVTIVLAYLFLKERMVLNQKIGAILILTGLILISIV